MAPLGTLPGTAIARAMLLALTVGVGYEVAARALPFERDGLAWTALAPVLAERWVAARLVAVSTLAFPLLACACGAIGIWLGLAPLEWLATLALVLPALALAQILGLLTGAAFGDPR